nr:hypothetical protein [Tanacetum cinerariifolium]
MFGFCCYIKVSNQESLINLLSNVWIGKLQLYANVARFDRKLDGKPPHARVQVVKHAHASPKITPKTKMASSYVNVARGSSNCESKTPNTVHEGAGTNMPLIILSQDKPNDFPVALRGCYKDFQEIANTRSMRRNEGILTWFSTLKPWYDDFVVDERLIWLEVEGVPIRPWDNQVFSQICSKWARVIFIDDTDVSNRLSKREFCSWTPTFIVPDNECEIS